MPEWLPPGAILMVGALLIPFLRGKLRQGWMLALPILGAVQIADGLGDEDSCVATLFCDSNKKYLSTDLLGDEPVRDGHWTQRIEFDSFTAVR